MDERTQLVKFVETAKGLEPIQKLKLILFATGAKKNTYIKLKINPSNLDEKQHFEQHLKHNNIIYETNEAKSYEEITAVKENKILWEMQGVWFGYDLFSTKAEQQKFHIYKKYIKQQKHLQADVIAGALYDYPQCCIAEYTKEHNTNYLRKKYNYTTFYQRMQENEKKFPFIAHYPCSLNCKKTKKLNAFYSNTIKKYSPKFWKEYARKKTLTTDIIIDTESDIFDDNAHPLWPQRNSHDYTVITKKPVNRHYYLLSTLTNTQLIKGTVASATITLQHNHADVKRD